MTADSALNREPTNVIGAIIAGGRSVRFGSDKALAVVGGVRVVDRVAAALRGVCADIVLIANNEDLAVEIGLPWRADRYPDLGPLAGIDAALAWAAERGAPGIIAAACDMPFLPAGMLALLLERARDSGADAVLPSSTGPRGVEPLAAYYSVRCIPAIGDARARGDGRLIAFHEDVRVERIALHDVRGFGDPSLLFMNLNTTADLAAAERAFARGAA